MRKVIPRLSIERQPELRKDPVSGDWILLAPGRRKRPHARGRGKAVCPFEHIGRGRLAPLFLARNGSDWLVQVIPNKFPALFHKEACASRVKLGPYTATEGIGYHELLITRDHFQNFADLSFESARQVFRGFRERYQFFAKDPCLKYVSFFENWGVRAGASLAHPHYQIVAIPIVPPQVKHSLFGSLAYSKKYKTCVHCAMIRFETQKRSRVIVENDAAVVVAPFVSREPFEMCLFPKRHSPFFEDTKESHLDAVIEALQEALGRLGHALKNPDYNFFLHTAPLQRNKKYTDYHWHIEILPHINISAGFELGTGIEINTVDPDIAAALLRKVKV